MLLKNTYNEPLELSSLLVHVDIQVQVPTAEYQSLQELRMEIRRQQQRRDDLVQQITKAGGMDAVGFPVICCGVCCDYCMVG